MDPGRPYAGYAQPQPPGSAAPPASVPYMAAPAQAYPPVPQPGFRPEQLYGDKRKERLSTSFSPDHVFTWTSILLLVTLMVIPVWNACALLTDENYVYWAGRAVPALMICACIGIVTVYVVTMLLFFKWARPSVRSSEQTVMMVVNMFITLLGLTLMLISLPLSRQAADTYIALTHRCDYDDLTHRTFEYWTVLHNIRAQPECASKPSVEECAGYEVAAPYTTFIKTMETNFRCSGFCWKPPPALADSSASAAASAGDASASGDASAGAEYKLLYAGKSCTKYDSYHDYDGAYAGTGTLIGQDKNSASVDACLADCKAHSDCKYFTYYDSTTWCSLFRECGDAGDHPDGANSYEMTSGTASGSGGGGASSGSGTASSGSGSSGSTSLMHIRPHTHAKTVTHKRHRMLSFLQEGAVDTPTSPFPPSLFSHTVAQASCEGMAGRDMRNFAGDIGYQTFYQGIYLVVIAIVTGFLKLLGACLARDKADQSLAY